MILALLFILFLQLQLLQALQYKAVSITDGTFTQILILKQIPFLWLQLDIEDGLVEFYLM